MLVTIGAGAGIGVTAGVLPLNTGAGSRTVERRRGGSAAEAGCEAGAAAIGEDTGSADMGWGSGCGAGSIRGV